MQGIITASEAVGLTISFDPVSHCTGFLDLVANNGPQLSNYLLVHSWPPITQARGKRIRIEQDDIIAGEEYALLPV